MPRNALAAQIQGDSNPCGSSDWLVEQRPRNEAPARPMLTLAPRRRAALIAALVVWGAVAGRSVAADPAGAETPPRAWRVEEQGIALELSLHPTVGGTALAMREGDEVLFRIRVEDTATGEPLAGLYPAAWMARLVEGESPDPRRCVEKVEEYVGGSILAQPELDLNGYFVLALNDDSTLSVVDPLFGFGGSKLLAMPMLPGPGEDWALSADTRKLFVSVPDADRVVVVSGVSWQVESAIELRGRPSRLALQPDGRYLWVSVEAVDGRPPGVAVIDTREERVLARLDTGPGPHEIAHTRDNRFALVANAGSGTVSVIDVAKLEKVRDLATGKRPVSIAYSPLAEAAYVSHDQDGTIAVIDAERGVVRATIAARPGLGAIRFDPRGRYAFVVSPRLDRLDIVDSASDRIIQSADIEWAPDQVVFTDRLAYIRRRESEIVLMVPLDEIGEPGAAVPVVDFPGGQEPFGRGRLPSRADSMVQVPGADAMLIANPGDKAIYYYVEGMAAPMGTFQNYERQPRGVLVVDRSLQERGGRGIYETTARLPRPGRYQVAVYLDTPRIVRCFVTEVRPDPVLEAEPAAERPLTVEPLMQGAVWAAGSEARVGFRLLDPRTETPRTGLGDVVVLAYTPGGWQQRLAAREVGDGVYEVPFAAPAPGVYSFAVASPSGKLRFDQSPQVRVRVVAGDR